MRRVVARSAPRLRAVRGPGRAADHKECILSSCSPPPGRLSSSCAPCFAPSAAAASPAAKGAPLPCWPSASELFGRGPCRLRAHTATSDVRSGAAAGVGNPNGRGGNQFVSAGRECGMSTFAADRAGATIAGLASHKCIPGTAFTVDSFKPQPWIRGYWLTHAHSGEHSLAHCMLRDACRPRFSPPCPDHAIAHPQTTTAASPRTGRRAQYTAARCACCSQQQAVPQPCGQPGVRAWMTPPSSRRPSHPAQQDACIMVVPCRSRRSCCRI
jgi:hypothetical protein